MVIDLVCSYFCCLLRAKQGRATGKEQKAFSNAWVTLAIVTHPDRASYGRVTGRKKQHLLVWQNALQTIYSDTSKGIGDRDPILLLLVGCTVTVT